MNAAYVNGLSPALEGKKEDHSLPREHTLVVSTLGQNYDVTRILDAIQSEYIRVVCKEISLCMDPDVNTGFGLSILRMNNVNSEFQHGDASKNLLKTAAYYVNSGDKILINTQQVGRSKSDLVLHRSQLAQFNNQVSLSLDTSGVTIVNIEYIMVELVFSPAKEL